MADRQDSRAEAKPLCRSFLCGSCLSGFPVLSVFNVLMPVDPGHLFAEWFPWM